MTDIKNTTGETLLDLYRLLTPENKTKFQTKLGELLKEQATEQEDYLDSMSDQITDALTALDTVFMAIRNSDKFGLSDLQDVIDVSLGVYLQDLSSNDEGHIETQREHYTISRQSDEEPLARLADELELLAKSCRMKGATR